MRSSTRSEQALNHPNIGSIHGLEEANGLTALVMELVEGEDLAQRIARGAIPIDEALPIARQIAEALEAAHEQGIIHRDLKPANIKLRADGTVKVLDFGLAKAIEPAGAASASVSLSPTITSPAAMTGAGMLLGTAAYMAPEQARGKPVDRRADIWAFGCVLYQMLTGKRAFAGDDVSDTLVAVLRDEPDWHMLGPTTAKVCWVGCGEKPMSVMFRGSIKRMWPICPATGRYCSSVRQDLRSPERRRDRDGARLPLGSVNGRGRTMERVRTRSRWRGLRSSDRAHAGRTFVRVHLWPLLV